MSAPAEVKMDESSSENTATAMSLSLSLDDSSAASAPPPTLKLTSKDKKEFVVERSHALVSTLVKTSLETDSSATEVPIPGVDGKVMSEISLYLTHHKGVEQPIIEKPLRSKQMKDVVKDAWDAEFIDRIGETRQLLYDLIEGANYMDIKSLMHLGCAKVASLIKGQPLEKIKEILSKGIAPKPAAAGEVKESKEEKGTS